MDYVTCILGIGYWDSEQILQGDLVAQNAGSKILFWNGQATMSTHTELECAVLISS